MNKVEVESVIGKGQNIKIDGVKIEKLKHYYVSASHERKNVFQISMVFLTDDLTVVTNKE
jgi:hypothetical protein